MPEASVRPDIFDDRKRTRTGRDLMLPIAAIAVLAVIALLSPTLQPGPYIGRLTVVNNSEYAFDVDVAGAKADDWMLLASAIDHANTSVGEVYDQGPTWTFRFAVQGRVLGTVVESRADLVRASWRVTVPDRFVQTLRAGGLAPTA